MLFKGRLTSIYDVEQIKTHLYLNFYSIKKKITTLIGHKFIFGTIHKDTFANGQHVRDETAYCVAWVEILVDVYADWET